MEDKGEGHRLLVSEISESFIMFYMEKGGGVPISFGPAYSL